MRRNARTKPQGNGTFGEEKGRKILPGSRGSWKPWWGGAWCPGEGGRAWLVPVKLNYVRSIEVNSKGFFWNSPVNVKLVKIVRQNR